MFNWLIGFGVTVTVIITIVYCFRRIEQQILSFGPIGRSVNIHEYEQIGVLDYQVMKMSLRLLLKDGQKQGMRLALEMDK